jgi:hypothetical protein
VGAGGLLKGTHPKNSYRFMFLTDPFLFSGLVNNADGGNLR